MRRDAIQKEKLKCTQPQRDAHRLIKLGLVRQHFRDLLV